jgi:hypothetical protein
VSRLRFLKYCNEELLKDVLEADPTRKPITKSTAHQWLHTLGFTYERHRKGMYYDGHERSDVICHRSELLVQLEVLREVTVTFVGEDCEEIIWPDMHPGEPPLIVVVQVPCSPLALPSLDPLAVPAHALHTTLR